MADKKEMKRDVAVFANMLKEIMNESESDQLITLDRDLQHFIYGRVAVLVKHNDGQPIGTVGDLGAIVGGAFATILGEFLKDRVNDPMAMQQLVLTARENMLQGFESRAPAVIPKAETEATEQTAEATE
jgi:hypothetical protein